MTGRDMNPRTCVATKEEKSPDEMIRFVLDPENRVVPDLKRNLPGRGVWVTAEKEKVLEVVKKNLFARGFNHAVKADAGLADMIEERLKTSLSGLVSMARKAGVAAIGQAKVEELARRGEILVLIQAADSDGDGKQKIGRLLEKQHQKPVTFEAFTSMELDQLLGTVNTVHVGFAESHLTGQVAKAIERIKAFTDMQ
ncbi:MAG: RNA-binding protein [Rhizobiaceae bacterium]